MSASTSAPRTEEPDTAPRGLLAPWAAHGPLPRLLLGLTVASMAVGALVGGLLVVEVSVAAALALATLVAVLVVVAAHRVAAGSTAPWTAGI